MPHANVARKDKIIGIISGMGPHAGLDLAQKIIDQTVADEDQDHLPVALLSYPERLIDRSTFLFGETDINPAYELADIARRLEGAGAVVAGMPCNTAHAAPIFDTIVEELERTGHRLRLLHIVEETARFLREHIPTAVRIGTLSTLAVYELGIHRKPLEAAGYQVVTPDKDMQRDVVNRVIFDTTFGLKAESHPPTDKARAYMADAINHLREKGADAIMLGCTELPLALPIPGIDADIPLIDPAEILARALIRETYPEALKPATATIAVA